MQQYERLELYTESATLVSPTGKQYDLTAFDLQPIEYAYDIHGYELVTPVGKPQRVVRFYPDEWGRWDIITAEEHFIIEVEKSAGGYVQVDDRDRRYFCLTDGTPWLPMGINLTFISPVGKSSGDEFGLHGWCWLGMRQYERWFRRCAENGVNLARIWLGHEYLCPDTEEAGVLDPVQLAKLDTLLDLAERYGLRLKITVEQFRHCNYDRVADSNSYADDVFRKFNKKLWKNGIRCESAGEWMRERIWRDAWLQKMEQLAQRIAGNPVVFGIELWNEMNCMPRDCLGEWNREMLPKVKALFPRQLVMNSLGSFDADAVLKIYRDFPWDCSEVMQMHRYLDQGASYTVCHEDPIELIRDGIQKLAAADKPFFVAETGAVNDCHSGPFRYYACDHDGMLFCDCVYTALFCGAAGCGHIWHWDERYVESKNLYGLFKPLSQLTQGIDFAAEGFQPDFVQDDRTTLLLLRGKSVTLGYLRNRTYNWRDVLRDGLTPEPLDYTLPLEGKCTLVPIREMPRLDGRTVRGLGFGLLFKVEHT